MSNTAGYFRANAANLLSTEVLALVKAHLKPDGIFFYNTTDFERVQRTACLSFPYGARFTNHLVVFVSPPVWDFDNWRHTLEAYLIDGRPVLDFGRSPDRQRMNQLMSLKLDLATAPGSSQEHTIESCSQILGRTANRMPVTDNNMGSEWRHNLKTE